MTGSGPCLLHDAAFFILFRGGECEEQLPEYLVRLGSFAMCFEIFRLRLWGGRGGQGCSRSVESPLGDSKSAFTFTADIKWIPVTPFKPVIMADENKAISSLERAALELIELSSITCNKNNTETVGKLEIKGLHLTF